MPSHLKDLVRARMEKTGESYEQALRHVRAQETRPPEEKPAPVPYEKSSERTRSVADTAFSIAAVRADEGKLPEAERLFDDPYAAIFAAGGAHAAEATQRFLDLPFFRDGVRLRTRFIDDYVRQSLAAGAPQLVLLGAGFDARGLRIPEVAERRVAVFEVDTPEQLARKRRLLDDAGVKLPPRVTYVPFEFDRHDIETELPAVLEERGFRLGGGALFVWEGVIGYIDSEEIDRSLRFMVKAGGPGSRLVFTYAGVGVFEQEPATERLRRVGFSASDEVGGDELWRKYLPGEPFPTAWIVKLGTAVV
jgi:methyltransferase (TIGR00027 family)